MRPWIPLSLKKLKTLLIVTSLIYIDGKITEGSCRTGVIKNILC